MQSNKIKLRLSEARILCFISIAENARCFARQISAQLRIDYSYTLQMLAALESLNYINHTKRGVKKYWGLTEWAPMKKAKALI